MAASAGRRWILWSAPGFIAAAAIAAVLLLWRQGLDPYRGAIEQIVTRSTGRPFRLLGRIELRLVPLAIVTGPAELDNPTGIPGPPLVSWRSARVGLELLPLLHRRLVIGRVWLEGVQVHLRRMADGRSNWSGFAGQARGGRGGVAGASPAFAGLGGATLAAIRIGGLAVSGSIEVRDGKAQYVRMSRVRLDVGPCRFANRVRIGRVRMSALVESSALGTARSARDAGISPPASALPAAAAIPVRLDVAGATVAPRRSGLIIPQWSLRFAGARLRGSLSVENAGGLSAQGPIAVRIDSVRALVASLGIAGLHPQDARALGALTLTGAWSLAHGVLALRPLRLHLDDTTVTGWIVRQRAAGKPLIELALHGDHVDLDRYLASSGASRRHFTLPVAALRALRIEGSITFDQARFAHVELKNVRLAIPPPTGSGRDASAKAASGRIDGGAHTMGSA